LCGREETINQAGSGTLHHDCDQEREGGGIIFSPSWEPRVIQLCQISNNARHLCNLLGCGWCGPGSTMDLYTVYVGYP
jgi:hypothetical protein